MSDGGGAHGGDAVLPDGTVAWLDLIVAFALLFIVPQVLFPGGSAELAERIERGVLGTTVAVVMLIAYAFTTRSRLPLRFESRAILLYLVFLVAWIPLAMIVYPYLVRAAGGELHAQGALLYFAGDAVGDRFWLVVLIVCVGSPIAEELVFRGYLFRLCEEQFNRFVALVVSSVLFGAVHDPQVIVPITVLGLLFGYVRMKTGGIAAPIVLHVLHNTWTVCVILYSPSLLELVYDK